MSAHIYKNKLLDGDLHETVVFCTLMPNWQQMVSFGDPGRNRTLSLLIRSQLLYPVELRGRVHTVRKAVRGHVIDATSTEFKAKNTY